ncbi:MAG: Uncharacterised protein [Prochlorococcus marinus str. MIT 9215]|nr:MAG: Uncharacterised protein [Prochlorococcus marinus str. MIT 9215]
MPIPRASCLALARLHIGISEADLVFASFDLVLSVRASYMPELVGGEALGSRGFALSNFHESIRTLRAKFDGLRLIFLFEAAVYPKQKICR